MNNFKSDAREAARAHVKDFGFIKNPQMESDFTDGAEFGARRMIEVVRSRGRSRISGSYTESVIYDELSDYLEKILEREE